MLNAGNLLNREGAEVHKDRVFVLSFKRLRPFYCTAPTQHNDDRGHPLHIFMGRGDGALEDRRGDFDWAHWGTVHPHQHSVQCGWC